MLMLDFLHQILHYKAHCPLFPLYSRLPCSRYSFMHGEDNTAVNRPPMLKSGMIHRLKKELVCALAVSDSGSASWWCPQAGSMMELLSVAETRMVVKAGGQGELGGWSLGEKEMARKRGEISEGVKKKRGGGLSWGRRNEGGRHEVSKRESSSSSHYSLQTPPGHTGQPEVSMR